MRTIVVIVSALLMLAGAPRAAETPEDAAQKAAESWLKLMDQGKYEESWDAASTIFKGVVARLQWKQTASGVRGPLGSLVSRTLKSRKYTETLPGAPDGKYVVLQYDSVFTGKQDAVETITPMLDADGQWHVSGYYIR
jgi:outer membrane biogenesis lipoprotein LolB